METGLWSYTVAKRISGSGRGIVFVFVGLNSNVLFVHSLHGEALRSRAVKKKNTKSGLSYRPRLM